MDRDLLRFDATLDQVRSETWAAWAAMKDDERVALFRACGAGRLADLDADQARLVGRLAALATVGRLGMADQDPPAEDADSEVSPSLACPTCGQREVDELVWLDDERVQCRRCRTSYRPGGDDPATE